MWLRLADPSRRLQRVRLDAGPFSGPCIFRDGAWQRQVDTRQLQRLEYQFVAGRSRNILDPLCPNTIQSPFGPKSEWRSQSYEPPRWLSAPAVRGRMRTLELRSAFTQPLRVRLWLPAGLTAASPAPLLWCNDGSDYWQAGGLEQWAGAMIAAGDLPPMRIALSDAFRRSQWYSASPRFQRTFRLALDQLATVAPIDRPVAVMGASLGGLTALLSGLSDERVGAVLSQSGSFFPPGLTGSDSDANFRWYERISTAVAAIEHGPIRRGGLRVAMTCGRAEGNFANNKAMCAALRRHGIPVTWQPVADLHNMTAWRDSLDPILQNLLKTAWTR